jgi:hypothetical protein
MPILEKVHRRFRPMGNIPGLLLSQMLHNWRTIQHAVLRGCSVRLFWSVGGLMMTRGLIGF